MTDTVGSSNLTPEQGEAFFNRFGVRYTHVQETPLRLSRRLRRKFGVEYPNEDSRVNQALYERMRYCSEKEQQRQLGIFWRNVAAKAPKERKAASGAVTDSLFAKAA